ncbi:MAG TPA: cellulase family glycosylhydrolase [Candidatus Saccharimonadales bacterium]|nr:cellulase family glycosylhydrolase [Candidatus Saccharimonadales bacterium]
MGKKVKNHSKKKYKIKKLLLFFIVIFLLLILLFILLRKRIPFFPNAGDIPVTPYVSAVGTNLYVSGERYQFTGVNAFNLGSYTGNAGCGGQANDLDAFFAQLRPNSTVRMWAYQGSITTNTTTKQTDWTGLDRVVAAAQKDGIKLILVLSDQAGTCDDGHWKDQAWYAGGYAQAFNDTGNGLTPLPYLDYVKLVVARYKDSPTIAMWEPVNEPESSDCQNAQGSACYTKETCNEGTARIALRSFFDTVGGAIKSIDKNHLVSSGVIGNGQCGVQFEDYQYVHESPGIDVASYHDYGSNDQAMPGDEWNGLQKRLNQMTLISKPLIIGEVGMLAKDNTAGCISYASRRDKLKAKMDAQFKAGIAGFMPWDLSGGVSAVCNYDIVDNDPTIALLRDYPVSMGTVIDRQAPIAPTHVTFVANSPSQITLNWTASTDNIGVVRYDIFRNDAYLTSTTNTNVVITNVDSSVSNTYFVKGKDATGNNSGSSNSVTVLPAPDLQAPSSPGTLTATQITLTWKASTDNIGVVRYDIFRNDTYLTSTTGTSFTNSNLTPSTTYTYFVKGKDAAGNNSGGSNRVTITTSAAQN